MNKIEMTMVSYKKTAGTCLVPAGILFSYQIFI